MAILSFTISWIIGLATLMINLNNSLVNLSFLDLAEGKTPPRNLLNLWDVVRTNLI